MNNVSAIELQSIIDSVWDRRAELGADEIATSVGPAVDRVIAGLEAGEFRVAAPDGQGGWTRAAAIGYPAGNSRTMTYDVTGFLGPAVSRCRIRTNWPRWARCCACIACMPAANWTVGRRRCG